MTRLKGRDATVVAAFAVALLSGTAPSHAADTTYERLLNPEPQNWLTHHHDFSAQRFSSLDVINRLLSEVKPSTDGKTAR